MLILNGSPNKNGHTMRLAKDIFGNGGHNVLHLYDLDIKSCDDCKLCQKKIGCKYNQDDWPKLHDALQDEETLVLVSPIYFGTLTDKLLAALNRFQQVFAAKFTHKAETPGVKHLYLVTTCGADNSVMFEGVEITMTILKQLLSAKHMHVFSLANTDNENQAFKQERIETFQAIVKKDAEG